MKAKFLLMYLLTLAFVLTFSSCEKDDEGEKSDSEDTVSNGVQRATMDENGNVAIIKIRVTDYATDTLEYEDENGDMQTYSYEYSINFTGKTVYMFDTEDVSDKSKAIMRAITDAESTATFELTEDYFKETNPAFYFAIYDTDGNVAGQGALNIKKGKEAIVAIDTKGNTSGAVVTNLVKLYELHSLAEDYKLNVKARGNLVNDNHTRVQITLPENTVSWYFSFNCVESSNTNASLGFFAALLKYFDPTDGLVSGALEKIIQPNGSMDCNIYLEDEYGNFLCNKVDHLTDGKMDEKQFISGVYYLVFENPFTFRGLNINLSVVAMTCE